MLRYRLADVRMLTFHDTTIEVITADGSQKYEFKSRDEMERAFAEWTNANRDADGPDSLPENAVPFPS